MACSWETAARLLATTQLSVTEVAREARVTEFQLLLWLSDANFRQRLEKLMREGSSKYGTDVRNKVARWLATTDLGMRDIAFLAGVPLTQVSRWARDPEFNQTVEKLRQVIPAVSNDDPPEDDDGGEWSPPITTFHYKKIRR